MSIHYFNVEKPSGELTSLSEYKGKVVLVVNTASECTYTPQFEDLQKLYEAYREKGLEILGFPCNQFGGQEPGTSSEAESFCKLNYGVTFPIFSKLDVNGDEAHPLFDYLKKKKTFAGFDESNIQAKLLKMMVSEKGPEWLIGDAIKWNFTKFLIDQEGQVIKRFEPYEDLSEISSEIDKRL